jgi:uncharacterized protein YdhG (YjbR/CyaY superfamily)
VSVRAFGASVRGIHGPPPGKAVLHPPLSPSPVRCHNDRMPELTDYIATLDEPSKSVVDGWRLRALELVPSAEEGTSYGMAALRYRGRPLISVVTTKSGYSVFPFSADVVAHAAPQLDGFATTKGGIRFSDEQPLPDGVFDGLVLGRRDEIDAALGT